MKPIHFLLLSLLGILFGCSYGPPPEPIRAAAPNARLVRGIWYNPGAAWRSSPWFRAHLDDTTPTRVVIAVDDSACIMDNSVIEPRAQEFYICPSAWRRPRNF